MIFFLSVRNLSCPGDKKWTLFVDFNEKINKKMDLNKIVLNPEQCPPIAHLLDAINIIAP